MAVFILTLNDKSSGVIRLVKNLGVFQKRSQAYLFIVNERTHLNPPLLGGHFKFVDLQSIQAREQELGYNPDKELIYENDFWCVLAEKANLV